MPERKGRCNRKGGQKKVGVGGRNPAREGRSGRQLWRNLKPKKGLLRRGEGLRRGRKVRENRSGGTRFKGTWGGAHMKRKKVNRSQGITAKRKRRRGVAQRTATRKQYFSCKREGGITLFSE